MQKAIRRNQLAFTAAVAVVAALLFGISASLWQASVATRAKDESLREKTAKEREARIAQQERDRALAARLIADAKTEEARGFLYAADMKLAQLAVRERDLGQAVALLERHRPRPGERDLRGFEWRYLWGQTRGQELASLQLTSGAIKDVAFSPDQRWLAVACAGGLNLVDLETWEERGFIAGISNQLNFVQFSPDGETLLGGNPSQVLLWDTLTWQPKAKLEQAAGTAGFSPDGRTLLSDGPGGVQIRDAHSLALLHQLPGRTIRTQWDGVGGSLAG